MSLNRILKYSLILWTWFCLGYGVAQDNTTNEAQSSVRLLSGSGSFEGVVQHQVNRNDSGLICDPDWSDKEANVTCRQLGYQYGRSEKPVSLGPLSGTIFYHDYQCNGTEQQIGDCVYIAESSDVQCNSNHIAEVSCGPPIDFDLRMTGSEFTEQGRLEVFLAGEWGYVTTEDFSYGVHDTACRHLGYAGGVRTYIVDDVFARSSYPILIDNLACHENDMRITDCYVLELSGKNSTRREKEVSVLCFPYENVANHPVRFRDDNGLINQDYGIIEIYHDGIWAPMCDSHFYNYEMLCSELGHTNLTNAGGLSNYYTYTSRDPVWFILSNCPTYDATYGVEHDKLYECRHGVWAWGREECTAYLSTARCVYVDQTDLYTGTPDDSELGLVGWQIFLIVIAVVIPICIVIYCCYRYQHTQTTSSTGTSSAAYTSATNVTSIDGVSAKSAESPPAYDSVTTPMVHGDVKAENL